MGTTAEAIRPRDLEVGDHVELDLGAPQKDRGKVLKNDTKAGRLKLRKDGDGGDVSIPYKMVEGVERVTEETGGNGGSKAGRERLAQRARSTGGKRPKYPAEITAAVRRAKEVRGTPHGAPGAKQHVKVRDQVDKRVGRPGPGSKPAPAKADEVLVIVGMTKAVLVKAASGKMPTEKLREQEGLRQLAREVGDPYCTGRNLASILVALVEEREAAQKKARA